MKFTLTYSLGLESKTYYLPLSDEDRAELKYNINHVASLCTDDQVTGYHILATMHQIPYVDLPTKYWFGDYAKMIVANLFL